VDEFQGEALDDRRHRAVLCEGISLNDCAIPDRHCRGDHHPIVMGVKIKTGKRKRYAEGQYRDCQGTW
jgi:hypothetical protein